jgi:hypothetical protein
MRKIAMNTYLVDLVDANTQVHQRIWVKTKSPLSPKEMQSYVENLDGLKVQEPRLFSFVEKTLPCRIRQELVEKVFQVYTR